MRLTIQMSNIAVVPRFQKLWALTSALGSAGTCTCPSLLTNTAAPFTIGTLPHWASPTTAVTPSAVPPSCHDPAPVLSPCTDLLLIFGSQVIALGTGAQALRVPHSFAVSPCRVRTRPPFGHDRACLIENFLPQLLQVAGMS